MPSTQRNKIVQSFQYVHDGGIIDEIQLLGNIAQQNRSTVFHEKHQDLVLQ
jgi:hypothetical protein